MRLALLSDVHGNPIALDAVLADIRAGGGADGYWLLGDFVAIGPEPIPVLDHITTLAEARFVRGNTDRYIVTGGRSPRAPTLATVQTDPQQLATLIEIERSFSWTLGAVTATGWLPWLAALPLEQRLVLPDGTRLLGVHASPGCDDGAGIKVGMDDDALEAMLRNCHADLVVVGHTHIALDRLVGNTRVVNLGSVSNPPVGEPCASYALLDAERSGYRIEQRRVAYDGEAVIAAIHRSGHPTAAFLTHFWEHGGCMPMSTD